MKKLWFFVEGDSEEYFVLNFIRKQYFSTITIEKDLSEFVNKATDSIFQNVLYCENCNSVEKIPHKINEWYYLIERSGSTDIFIICDVERKLRCPPNRRRLIESKLADFVNKNYLNYILFNPIIEDSYWECKQTIESIIKKEYSKKFPQAQLPELSLPNISSASIDDLKKCFKNYQLKYREALFAREFFPSVDFKSCKNIVLKRAMRLLDETIEPKPGSKR